MVFMALFVTTNTFAVYTLAAGPAMILPEKDSAMYCIPAGNCTFGDGISDFVFAGIQNLSSGCSPDGFGDFTEMKASVEIGEQYSVTFSSNYNNQKVSLWIDSNRDSVFSDYERFVTDFVLAEAGMMYQAEIEIPMNARPGIYRLRVGSVWEMLSYPDPCADFSYGEWEDYSVEITGQPVHINVAVESIEMEPVMHAEPVKPWAVITNYGLDSAMFKVYMRENTTGYFSEYQFWALPPGVTKWFRFDTLDLPPRNYYISVFAELEGDEIPGDDFLSKQIIFSEQHRQKVITELFNGTWNYAGSYATEALDSLKQEYADTLAIIAWHIGDEFETPGALARDAWYRTSSYPTARIDGWKELQGAFAPTNYFYYKQHIKQRVSDPSNFEISVVLSEIDENTLNVKATVEMLHGNTNENLAAFIVLTESNLLSPGNEKQNGVVRRVFTDATTGQPIDFSIQNSFTWDTPVVMEEDFVIENCQFVVFLQNMDTREIYQGAGRMADDITGIVEPAQTDETKIYPNPARNQLSVKSNHQILRVSVFNSHGQKVIEIGGSENFLNLKTANFEPGIYLFRVQTTKAIFTKKVVIK